MNILLLVLIIGLLVWLAFMQWQTIRLKSSYKIFFSKTPTDNLQSKLNDYARDVADALNKLDQLASFSAQLHKKNLDSISKIGLVRFNPFGDTGGDQSFCLALLDANKNGLVISSIHARSGTRFYAKQIVAGAPSHPLSDEEQQAYHQAIAKKKTE